MQRVKKLNFLCKDSGGHVYRLIFYTINCFVFFMKVHPYQKANCILYDVFALVIIDTICFYEFHFLLGIFCHVMFIND